jgi:hypothetical protein
MSKRTEHTETHVVPTIRYKKIFFCCLLYLLKKQEISKYFQELFGLVCAYP